MSRRALLPAALAAALAACSPSASTGDEPPGSGSGGAMGQGGAGSGGRVAATVGSGGASASGGQSAQGGGGPAGSGGQAGSGSGGSAGDGSGGAGSGSGDAAAETGSAPGDSGDPVTGTPDRSAGCGAGQGLPEGDAMIMVGGMNRQYRVHLPKGYSKDRAWPLVLALHPNGGAGIGYFDSAGRSIAALMADKGIVILPLARPMGGGWDWRGNLPADLAYFDALLTKVKTELCIDTKRIFSLGFSGGGSFSGVLGCRRSDIRAIATGGAVSYFDPKDCVGNPAAWITIGNGEVEAGRTNFRDFWRNRATCMPASMPVDPSPCIGYTCPADRPVHFCSHPGGHVWPSFASQAAVDFFSKF
jgi:polyhydroxybutyrate depolymerase